MKKLVAALIIIGLFALSGIAIAVYKPKIKIYTIPEARKGFILGARTNNAFLFLFYQHPSEGEAPLQQYAILYSNELTIYALAYTDTTTENLTFHMYRLEEVKQGNTTIEVKRDVQNITVTLILRKYQIVKNVIELPTHSEKFTVEIYTSNGNMIFKFYHETHPLFLPAKKYTLGSLFMDRLAYILGCLLVVFAALGACKQTVEKKKVVPRLSLGAGLWIMTVAAVLLYITARVLIYLFGLLNVAWTYIPIAFCSYIFGFSLLKPKTKNIYLLRIVPSSMPQADLQAIEVVEKNHKYYLANISWKDFIFGREYMLNFNEPRWKFDVIDSDDELYIFKKVEEQSEKISIELTGIHYKDVMEVLSEIKETENVAQALHQAKHDYFDLKSRFEAEKLQEITENIRKYVTPILKAIIPEKEKEEEEIEVEQGT